MQLRSFISIFAILPVLSLQAGYQLVQAPLPDDPMQVHIYRLDNGLTVYLTQNHETPTFRYEITVRAGAKDDPADATGLAHYLEHLLFKGNHRFGTIDWEAEKPHIERIAELYEQRFHAEDPEERERLFAEINKESQLAAQYAIPNEFDNIVSALGGSGVNAYTASDRTVYLAELPANRLEQWAILESNRFTNPVFRLFQPELEIVYEEKNRSLDNNDRILAEALFELLYGEHPYGSQTALGSVEHLKNPSLLKIHDFFDAHYVANNMAIALSGDFEIEPAMQIVERHFSSWKSGDIPAFDRPMPAPIIEKKSVTVHYPGEEQVVLGFDTAPIGHPDVEALKLLDMILDNANAGLINLNLNQAQKIQRGGTYPYIRNDAGSQFLWGVPKGGQTLEEVEQLLLEQLEILKTGAFDESIIDSIVTDFKKTQKLALETNSGRLRLITTSFGERQAWERTVGEIARIEKLDKEDIVRVANQYFSKPYVVAYRKDGDYSPPSVPKPVFDPIDVDRTRRSEFAASVLAIEVEPLEPEFLVEGRDYQVVDLADGVRLFYKENPANDLFSLSKVYEMGKQEMPKLPIAATLLDKSGTAQRSPEELKKAWYALGADFSFSVAEHSTVVGVSGLGENFDASIALLEEVFTQSEADPETLEKLIAITLKQKQDAKKDPNTLFAALRAYNRFGQESPFLRALSSDEISALTVDELIGLVKSLPSYQHDYLYVGKLPLETVAQKLQALDVGKTDLQAPPPRIAPSIREPQENEIYYIDYETAQSQLRMEFPDGVFDQELLPFIETFNEYFYGGMSGIVFQEMREARALAYSVWAYYLVSSYADGESLVMGNIGTQADKTIDALEAYLALWSDMPESEDRFAVTLSSLENQYKSSKLGFRKALSSVKSWQRQGFDRDPRAERYKSIAAGSLQDLMTFYRERIQGRPKLISILGPSSAIDLERLATFGPVKQIEIDEIFSK